MEREITLSSFPVRNIVNNRPGDFTTKFSPEIDLSDKNASYYLAFNSGAPAAQRAAKRSPIGITGRKRKPMKDFPYGYHG